MSFIDELHKTSDFHTVFCVVLSIQTNNSQIKTLYVNNNLFNS